MTFLHFRYRDRLGLLASSALAPGEAEWVQTHVAACPSCQAELSGLMAVASSLGADPARNRPLPISSEALRTRVLARIKTRAEAPRAEGSLALTLLALGLVGIGLGAGLFVSRSAAPPSEPSEVLASLQPSADTEFNDAAFYERLERTHTRADAARYLAEAQDILIQVSAAADCPDSPKDSVDVTREAQTSRSLLRRRAALVSGSRGTLLAAQGVMEEVEGVLQQVAELPKCTKRQDVDAIARTVDRRNLLMKIDLVAQELAAP